MRRVWVRGHENVRKRVLIQAAACNIGLLLRRQTGIGTPRSLQGRAVSAICRLIGRLIDRWASDARLWVQMDTDSARRLNRSSPSCLNSGAQRTDFFHGLLDPSRLQRGLVSRSVTQRIRAINAGVLGEEASEVGRAVQRGALNHRPQVVLLTEGTNDLDVIARRHASETGDAQSNTADLPQPTRTCCRRTGKRGQFHASHGVYTICGMMAAFGESTCLADDLHDVRWRPPRGRRRGMTSSLPHRAATTPWFGMEQASLSIRRPASITRDASVRASLEPYLPSNAAGGWQLGRRLSAGETGDPSLGAG